MGIHSLLVRGMLVGFIAGLLAFGFAKTFGEPNVDRSIAFEEAARARTGEAPDAELVSREVQAGLGLLTGSVVYAVALGGLFSIVFAFCYGRFDRLSPRTLAAVIAALAFVAVYAAPALKYPANPPAIGEPSTIGYRTALHFSMIAISISSMIAAISLGRLALPRVGAWNAFLAGAAGFLTLVVAAQYALPSIDEVPDGFPASTLWNFRIASFGIQAVIWSTIGLLFGGLTARSTVANLRPARQA